MSSSTNAAALRKVLAWLCGRVSADDCRAALGLPDVDALRALVNKQAERGAKAVRRKVAAQTPAGGNHDG